MATRRYSTAATLPLTRQDIVPVEPAERRSRHAEEEAWWAGASERASGPEVGSKGRDSLS